MECFTILSKEITGRIDPYYYSLEFRKLLNRKKTKLVSFDSLIEIITKGETPLWRGDTYLSEGTPFLKVQNISEEGIKGEITYVSDEVHKRMKRSQLKGGELLYTMAGTIGIATNLPETFGDANINQAIAKIILKNEINKEYIKYILNADFCKLQAKQSLTTSAQPNINFEQIKAIKIPLPSLETQKRIVSIMQSAYEQKKQKEQEAEKLLNSINNFILDKLGIKLPDLKDKKFYVVNSEEANKRVDPYYYQPKYLEVERALGKSKYKLIPLKDTFLDKLIKGILPKEEEKNGSVNVLQIRNIKICGLIDTNEHLTAKNIFSDEHKLNTGDVLIVITGATIGKVGLWLFERDNFFLGGDIVKFKTNNKFNPLYVQFFLLSAFGQLQIKRFITGATNKHLSPEDVKQIKIPFAPLDIQNKISKEIKKRMDEAERLKAKTNSVVEKAKEEVEAIILGK